MRIFQFCAIVLCSVTFFACSKKVQRSFVAADQVIVRSSTARDVPPPGESACNDPLNFTPKPSYPDHTPPLPVQINVHFMDLAEGKHNLNREQGRAFALDMIARCNAKLKTNAKMHLPLRNNTPVIPAPWYLTLAPDPLIPGQDGIYFHSDTALYYYIHGKNSNRTSREVINKYVVRPDTVINIFMMPHHPDSVGQPGYKAVGTGISLGTSIKMAQIFSPTLSSESCVGLLNHEIGHALGLSHTWGGNDGCDDTPKHTNCWYYTETPPCDSLVSNNMMDYNAWQIALTPCQLGRVMRNITNTDSRIRKFIRADWCTYDPDATITIRDSVYWKSPRDLAGDILIENGGVLQLSCRLSLAQGARIIVSPTGRLILDDCQIHNACGDQWEGIEIQSRGKESGAVEVFGSPRIENANHPIDLSR